MFSHLPKVTGQVRWIHTIPGWACLGTRSRVGEGSQLSLGHSNDKTIAQQAGRILQYHLVQSPHFNDGKLRARNGRKVFPRVT